MRILVLALTLALLFGGALGQTASQVRTANEAERAAIAAYRERSYSEFLKQMETANANRPNHPRLIYNLAAAYALNQRSDDALTAIERLNKMGLGFSFEKDEDFASLRETTRFKSAVATSAANLKPMSRSSRANVLSDKTLIPEGVAYDPKTKDLYVGSVHQRKIVVVDSKGVESDFSSESDGLFAAMGMKIDSARGLLWVATSAVPQMRGFKQEDAGRSGIFKYDLRRRKLVARYLLPAGERHTLGDLWIDEGGNVYATDSISPNIYRIDREKGDVAPFLTSDLFVSLQGITGGEYRDEIFVADYSKGIFRIDLSTKSITQLSPEPSVTLLGIDGLYCYKGRLIAIQNGVTPQRVVSVEISGDRVVAMTVLEANHEDFLEPTLGFIHRDEFRFVANSQWPLVNEKAELQTEKLRNPVILRLDLKKALAN